MKRLTQQITIGKFSFEFVTRVEISQSWKNQGDTAIITLPRAIKWKGKNIRDEIKRGDKVSISLGYDFSDKVEFEGVVSEVAAGIPIKIHCKDGFWELAQTTINKSWRTVDLKQLLLDILPVGLQYEAVDVQLGPFRASHTNVSKILNKLKTRYGLVSYFREEKLIVGFPYQYEYNTIKYRFQSNIIENKLSYRREDDVRIKVRAVSLFPDNSKLEIELGEADGELHTLHFFKLLETELKQQAEEKMKRLRFEGYRGNFIAFGQPYATHGDIAFIQDEEYPEKDGYYFIDKVIISSGIKGFRRNIYLGQKAGDG